MPTTDYTDATLGGTRRCDDPVRITPTFGKIWPITLPQIDSVAVTYVAGYDGLDIPHELRTWILLRAAAMYDNREEIVVDNRVAIDPLPFASQFLDTYRIDIF